MKVLLLSLFAVLLATGAFAQGNAMEDGIRRALERFRQEMPCGFPAQNIPILAPLQHAQVDASFNLNAVTFNGLIRNLVIGNLNSFQTRAARLNLINLRIELDLFLPFVSAQGQFVNAVGRAPQNCAISGNGQFQVRMNGVTLNLVARAAIVGGGLQIAEISARFQIQSFQSNINQFVGTPAQSQTCNRVLEQQMPTIMANNQARLSSYVENAFRPMLNNLVRGMTLQDFLDNINSPSTPSTCRP